MGCWGIKALESDEWLDIIIELEKILPKDGHLQLEKLSGGSKCWDAYGDVCEDGKVHTKPMVLAEVIMAYLDGEQYRLYGGSDKKSKEMLPAYSWCAWPGCSCGSISNIKKRRHCI